MGLAVNIGTRAVEYPLGEKQYWIDAAKEAAKSGIRTTCSLSFDEEPVNYDGPESFHYHDDDFEVGKGMTKAFNQICSEEGVQVSVQMNPVDFKTLYYIKNVCDKVVQVLYDQTFKLLEPGEDCVVQVSAHSLNPARPFLVKVLNNGVGE